MIGKVAFWVSCPAIWLYLRLGKRTRILLIHGDEFLVLRSWLGSGQWGLPGGGLHRGEQSLDGLIREVREETGISLSRRQITLAYQVNPGKSGLKFSYDCYVCQLPEKPAITLQGNEISVFAWQPVDDPELWLTKDTQDALSWWQNKGKFAKL